MRVVVVSCWKFRDTWDAFFPLFKRFWPDCPYPVTLVTDLWTDEDKSNRGWTPNWVTVSVAMKGQQWCPSLIRCLDSDLLTFDGQPKDAPVMLFLDDVFLNAPVRQDLIEHALEQMKTRNAGMVRLYPCPGSDEAYGDDYIGIVRKGSAYRVSTMTGIWNPSFLHKIASQFNTPWEFEIGGTVVADSMPEEVLSWKREVTPWPVQHYTTAITRGKWNKPAIDFCRRLGIDVDTSLREIA